MDRVPGIWNCWENKRRVFSVTQRGERLHPAFQLDPSTGEPRDAVAHLVAIFNSESTSDA